MHPDNDRIREALGVTAWHKAGYTGKRGLTLTGEDDIAKGTHGYYTRMAHLEIAPDRQISFPGRYGMGMVLDGNLDQAYPYIMSSGADVMYQSYYGSDEKWDDKVWPENLIMFSAAGNDGLSGDFVQRLKAKCICGVAALILLNGELTPAYFSSDNEYNDFASVGFIYLDGQPMKGTSFAAPVLAGMAALVNDLFIDKTGRPLKASAMYQFLKDCCVDLAAEGKDIDTGWGAPVLPPPDAVDIWKYQDKPEETEKETDDVTKEEFKNLYDEINPLYTSLTQVPDYWRAEAAELMRAGAIKGDGVNPIAIRRDTLQAVIINKRYIDGGAK